MVPYRRSMSELRPSATCNERPQEGRVPSEARSPSHCHCAIPFALSPNLGFVRGPAVGLAILVSLATPRPLPADESVSLEAIRAALDEQYRSIGTLWVRFTIASNSAEARSERRYEYARQGTQRLLISEPFVRPGSTVTERSWCSFDGVNGFELIYGVRSGQVETAIKTRSPPASWQSSDVPGQLLGLSIPGSTDSLPSLLARTTDAATSIEEVASVSCIRVDLGPFLVQGRPVNTLTVWLDPAVDHLPRRLMVMPVRLSDSHAGTREQPFELQKGEMAYELEVTEFIQIHDSLLDRLRWFPRRAVAIQQVEISIDEIKLNEAIPADKFVPELPLGAKLIEETGAAQQTISFVGGEEGQLLYEQRRRAESAPHAPLAASAPIDATPGADNWPRTLLTTCSLMLLFLATLLVIRRGRVAAKT